MISMTCKTNSDFSDTETREKVTHHSGTPVHHCNEQCLYRTDIHHTYSNQGNGNKLSQQLSLSLFLSPHITDGYSPVTATVLIQCTHWTMVMKWAELNLPLHLNTHPSTPAQEQVGVGSIGTGLTSLTRHGQQLWDRRTSSND